MARRWRIKFGPDGNCTLQQVMQLILNWHKIYLHLREKFLGLILTVRFLRIIPLIQSSVFSYGHRNPQGIAWSQDGMFVSSEHGPSGEMGTGHDEINLILKGKNYGWPKVVGDSSDDTFVNPILAQRSDNMCSERNNILRFRKNS